MSYIDGFVAAVPTAKKQDYIAFCKLMGQVMKATRGQADAAQATEMIRENMSTRR